MPDLYFITSPGEASAAAKWGYPMAHLAYGTGRERLELTVGPLALTTRGGWMVLTDHALPTDGEAAAFAAQVRRECRNRRYEAVLFDFEQPANDRAHDIIAAIAAAGLSFLVPPMYAEVFPQARVTVDSAISGGNLRTYLETQQKRWPGRICLALRPLRMRFPMPSAHSEGETLDAAALHTALTQYQSYFSRDLGCRYFTQQLNGRYFFTLFDDADSLRYKLAMADQLQIRTAVGLYQELVPFLPL